MEELKHKFSRIFIDKDSLGSPLALRVREIFPPEAIEIVEEQPLKERNGRLSAQEFGESKKMLYLTPFKGHFFKRCPGARPGLLCCNYFVLNLGQQCDMNCSYCYLQSFINNPVLTIYTNLDQALNELESMHRDLANSRIRVGTGEVIDSLSLDQLTLYSRTLIEAFRKFPQWTLEFKTKSAQVDQFLDCDHAKNVIVSWSVNPQFIVDAEEHGTASLEQRLQAALRCRERGFPVAFHIDPMIWHPDWKINYSDLVNKITSQFHPSDVAVISVGALRFQPEQKAMMRERFGMKSWVTRAEVHSGQDGKLRYDQALRREMFDHVLGLFKAAHRDWRVFLCMETPETWLSTTEQIPHRDPGLKDLFDPKVLHQHRNWSQILDTP